MKKYESRQSCVLAVAASSDGFGFAVFEAPDRIIDWGVRYIAEDKNKRCVAKVIDLIEWYKPQTIVIEDVAAKSTRRRKRIRSLLRTIARRSEKLGLSVYRYSRDQIRECFAPFHATTKDQIAKKLSVWFPQELKRILPKPRKLWEAENSKMALFDALALGVTYYNESDEGVLSTLKTRS